MRNETMWIIEPNWHRAPSAGYYATRPDKKLPENAVKISCDQGLMLADSERWRIYINGRKIWGCETWKELAQKYPQGMSGRELTADQYDRLVQQRIEDERNGGIVSVDPMTHPAPRF